MNTNLNTSLFNLEKDLPELNKTLEKIENSKHKLLTYLYLIELSQLLKESFRISFKVLKRENKKFKAMKATNANLFKAMNAAKLSKFNWTSSDFAHNGTKEMVDAEESITNDLNKLLRSMEKVEKAVNIFESRISILPFYLRKLLELFGIKEDFKKFKELTNNFLDNFSDTFDTFYALIGYERTKEDVEKVYKDYAVDNETDYVFKTQISKESIEKIETSSLSKLSLEDIRLGRF
jgi:hypothetical protein